MKNNNSFIYVSLLGLCLLWACGDDKKGGEKTSVQTEEKKVNTPAFNPDSAYSYVAKQVEFGPRVPNTPSHRKCGDYLESKLKSLGADVKVQNFTAEAFDGTKLSLRNIVGSINPKATKRILLASHWDSRPFADQDSANQKKPIDGANDGASGVGILLELIRSIQSSGLNPSVGVDVVFFDGEDYGQPDFYTEKEKSKDSWCLGSQYWSKNKHAENYSAYYGILLDMVGAKNARFAMEGVSMNYAPTIVEKVWNNAQNAGFGNYFIFQEVSAIIDDHSYVNEIAKIPMIDIIEYNVGGDNYFGDYWHTHNDNMDVIDKNTLKAVGQTLIETLYRE